MMEKKHQFILFVMLGILVVVGNVFLIEPKDNQLENAQTIKTKCRVDLAPCEITSDNNSYKVIVEGEVKPLKKFLIKLQDQNNSLNSAVIEFRMKDMDMGKNIFPFERIELGAWNANVIIPICTTDRRGWELELLLSSEDKVQKFIMYLVL